MRGKEIDALKAQVAILKDCIHEMAESEYNEHGCSRHKLEDFIPEIYRSTPDYCLAEIEAAAVEKFAMNTVVVGYADKSICNVANAWAAARRKEAQG